MAGGVPGMRVGLLANIDTRHVPVSKRMIRRRVSGIRETLSERFVEAFVEDYTPREVAFSFSVGVFITALPSLGTGVIAMVVLAVLFERMSKIALFAAIVVLNPAVKWGVYGASFTLGQFLLGPIPGVSFRNISVSFDMGMDVLARLWLGNLILAVVFAVVAYVAGLRLVNELRQRAREGDVPMLELATDSASTGNSASADDSASTEE